MIVDTYSADSLAMFSSGLVGNLASHTASQSVLSATRGLGKELARILRESRGYEQLALVLGK
jgi:hypothetical protein